jgi:outer membrane protein
MMKHLMMALALVVGMTTAASAQKLGHVDTQAILMDLPERTDAQAAIEARAAEYEMEMTSMQQQLQTKLQEYQSKAETWPAAIRQQKERELQALDQGLQEFAATVQNDLAQMEQELLMPMIERVQQAINDVGDELGFSYIFDTSAGATVYVGGEDVGPAIRAKLGM